MGTFSKIGIIGAGKMGNDIFHYLFDFDFHLILVAYTDDEMKQAQSWVDKKIRRLQRHGILDEVELKKKQDKIRITDSLEDVKDCHLIIESVPENLRLKQEIFEKLDQKVNTDCIFTTNSSSIIPSKIKSVLSENRTMFGLHFFYPVAIKEFVEVVYDDPDSNLEDKITAFLKSINKSYLLQNEESAFILNRFFLELQLKGYRLHSDEEYGYHVIDHAAKRLFSEIGLFEFMDHVGIDTMLESIRNFSMLDKKPKRFFPLISHLETLITMNRMGKKSGSGFYDYDGNLITEIQIPNDTQEYVEEQLQTVLDKFLDEIKENQWFELSTLNEAMKEYTGIDRQFIK